MAHIDDIDLLDVAGIVGLQDRYKSSRLDVRSDVEQGQSRDTLTGQSEAARNLAVTCNNIAASRQRHVGPVNDERPLVDVAREVEGDAIVGVQIVGRLRSLRAINCEGRIDPTRIATSARSSMRSMTRSVSTMSNLTSG